MPYLRTRGLSTTVRLAYALYKIASKYLPSMKQDLSPAEYVLLLGLLNALQAFLTESPFPGSDDDPGTLA